MAIVTLPELSQAQCVVTQDAKQQLTTTCTLSGLKGGSRIQVYQGSPCFTYPIWKKGQLQLDPQSRPIECLIKYDVSSQQVYCELEENKVVPVAPYRFSVDDHRFINLSHHLLHKRIPTYYELLYEGKTNLVVWRRRTLQSSYSQGLNGYNVVVKAGPNQNSDYSGRYEETVSYYLQRDGKFLQAIRLNRQSLIAALPNASLSVKNLLRSNSLEVEQVVRALALYDSTLPQASIRE